MARADLLDINDLPVELLAAGRRLIRPDQTALEAVWQRHGAWPAARPDRAAPKEAPHTR